MKKIVLISTLAASFLCAASDEQIISHFRTEISNQPLVKDMPIRVVERQKVPEYGDFEYAVVEIGKGDAAHTQKIRILTKGEFIFPEAVDVTKSVSLMQKAEDAAFLKKLTPLYKSESKANIISIGDSKKPAVVVFSDPECPYCRGELARINERLSNNSIKMILTPVHDRSALEKSVLIYEEAAKAKNDGQKIAILKKYFDANATVSAKVSDDKIKKIDDLRRKYFTAGLGSVPMTIEESKILGK